MEDSIFTQNLLSFGLTHQEAVLYEALLSHGEMTGYEIAKSTGISRSNAYSSLNSLVEKGAACLIQGESTKYTPIPITTFTNNTLRSLAKIAKTLQLQAPSPLPESTGYITIVGAENIHNKIIKMLQKTEFRLYIMAPIEILMKYKSHLEILVKQHKKIVILTDNFELSGAQVYKTTPEKSQIRLITDSSYVLTGELTGSKNDTCLFSGQKNLVSVMKEALKNKIILIQNKMEAI